MSIAAVTSAKFDITTGMLKCIGCPKKNYTDFVDPSDKNIA